MAEPFVAFKCDIREDDYNIVFPDENGQREPDGTFGLVRNEAEWVRMRSQLPPEHGPQFGTLRRFERKVFNSGDLEMPDGVKVRHWGFEDELNEPEDSDDRRTLPSPPIRVAGGDLVQVTLHATMRQHTIHHHGIEPDMDNDGVGHSSFEVFGRYTYQWRAHPANAGTYFYHCHVNTTLHVQMGMFGALIIDPPGTDLDTPVSLENPRNSLTDGPPEWDYHREAFWALYAVDPVWHELNHAAGMCGEDAGLNRFNPTYFLINKHAEDPGGPPVDAPDVAIDAQPGETVLLRMVNASYHPIEIDFGGLDPLVIESDGRGLRDQLDLSGLARRGRYVSAKWSQVGGRIAPAERYALLIKDTPAGTYPVTVKHHDWITQEVIGMTRTTVTVR
jgi:FtsP/CotA-like multicopper oxidase with cupredoxin domain